MSGKSKVKPRHDIKKEEALTQCLHGNLIRTTFPLVMIVHLANQISLLHLQLTGNRSQQSHRSET